MTKKVVIISILIFLVIYAVVFYPDDGLDPDGIFFPGGEVSEETDYEGDKNKEGTEYTEESEEGEEDGDNGDEVNITSDTVDLLSIEPYYEGGGMTSFNYEIVDSQGEKHSSGLFGFINKGHSDCYYLWKIRGQFSELTATGIITTDDLASSGAGSYKIYGDDVLLYSKDGLTADTKPYEISVNITGVDVLKIEMHGQGDGINNMNSCLCDIILNKCGGIRPSTEDDTSTTDTQESNKNTEIDLLSIEPYFKGRGMQSISHKVVDSCGNEYWSGLRGYCDEYTFTDHYFLWKINGQYSELTATGIISSQNLSSGYAGSYKIYGDDILLYSKNGLTADTKPYEISVDITGVDVLKIAMYGEKNELSCGMASYLCNIILHK